MFRDYRPWVPVLLWLGFIFLMSTDAGSAAHTSRIIGPLLRWMNPDMAERTAELVHLLVRKFAHVAEYMALAILLRRAILRSLRVPPGGWSWGAAGIAWLGATMYALTDELHQTLIASRTPLLGDVLIDSCGALLGLALVCAMQSLRPAASFVPSGDRRSSL